MGDGQINNQLEEATNFVIYVSHTRRANTIQIQSRCHLSRVINSDILRLVNPT